jgi:hypothetical protein
MPNTMKFLVTDVGPMVPELEPGDLVWVPFSHPPEGQWHEIPDGRCLLDCRSVLLWDRPE